jgi:hypothetical protein
LLLPRSRSEKLHWRRMAVACTLPAQPCRRRQNAAFTRTSRGWGPRTSVLPVQRDFRAAGGRLAHPFYFLSFLSDTFNRFPGFVKRDFTGVVIRLGPAEGFVICHSNPDRFIGRSPPGPHSPLSRAHGQDGDPKGAMGTLKGKPLPDPGPADPQAVVAAIHHGGHGKMDPPR